jgi:hypothetical protein
MLSEAGRWDEAEVELRRAVEVSVCAGHRASATIALTRSMSGGGPSWDGSDRVSAGTLMALTTGTDHSIRMNPRFSGSTVSNFRA